jgi:hypothetical protein
MGDGQHVWAASEWILMLRNCFVREEGEDLVLCAGLPLQWTRDQSSPMRLGPVSTEFGTITVHAEPAGDQLRISWDAQWRNAPRRIVIAAPGFQAVEVAPDQGQATAAAKSTMTETAS